MMIKESQQETKKQEKFECMNCGCYFWVDDRDGFECPNCKQIEINKKEHEFKITRVYGNPSRWTFTIKPIKKLLDKYVGDGKGWIDPFAGNNSPAEFTNDLNPETKAKEHLWAVEWCQKLKGEFNGILLNPPYSPRQMKECYNSIGFKPTTKDTQNSPLYQNVKKAIADKIKIGGYAITCGWNSYGWGKRFGFEPIELLIVCHSHAHNDTMVLVEKKIQQNLT